MTPRYVVLSKAADNACLAQLPHADVLYADQEEIELFPRTTQEALRPALIELLESDFVRIYVDDRVQDVAPNQPRILSTTEAIELAEQDWSVDGA